MSRDLTPEQRKELLDDFYAESEEGFGAMRAQLAELMRPGIGGADAKRAIEALYRNLHTLKGNSTIVGLTAAEELAHVAEDYLRELTRGRATLSGQGLDVLHLTLTRLEQIVTASRDGRTIPAVDDLSFSYRDLVPRAGGASTRAEPAKAPQAARAAEGTDDRVAAARARGLEILKCTFAPSQELDSRGVNVPSVRGRLQQIGEIISATPQIRGNGSIAFEFIVGASKSLGSLEEWRNDGVNVELVSPAAEGPATSAGSPILSAEAEASLLVAPSQVVRVELSRLDDLMRIAGELVIHRSRLEAKIAEVAGGNVAVREANLAFGRSMRELRLAITRTRLVPLTEIFSRMPFVVRDLSRGSAKQVRLVTEGQHTEVDKYLVERLKEPLLHLVRNAFSHGIESPEQRTAARKPPEGTIVLRAEPQGDAVVITIADDGAGVDVDGVLRRAQAAGLPMPTIRDEAGILELLCAPGLSTRDEADRSAGRGVGMSVVRTTLQQIGGQLSLQTKRGVGTTFTLRVPLTLSILDTIIVSIGTHTCAIPQTSILEMVQIASDSIRPLGSTEVIPYRDGVLPVTRLRKVFKVDGGERPEASVVVVNSERGAHGLVVDRIHTQKEVVLRPMKDPLLHVAGLYGATELGDGKPVLILDPFALTNGAVRPPTPEPEPSSSPV